MVYLLFILLVGWDNQYVNFLTNMLIFHPKAQNISSHTHVELSYLTHPVGQEIWTDDNH